MKIAIVKLSAMGDIVHTMIGLQFIKKTFPNIIIDWFVEPIFIPLLEENKDINNIYPISTKKLKKNKNYIFKLIKEIKVYSKNKYDIVIDAQGLLKSAIVSRLLKGKKIVGFNKTSIREPIASFFYNHKISIPYNENTIDRNMKVLCDVFNINISSKDILEKKPFLFFKKNETIDGLLSKDKKNIIFIIGSTWKSRNYPKEKFLEIANKLKENCLIAWGNKDEYEKGVWLEKNSLYIKLLPKIDLNSLKYIISKSDLLIGNDTGPTHIAWGLNKPSITLFGPTPINRIYQTPINKLLTSNSKVNHYKLNKNDFSIKEILVDDIIELSKELLC